MVFILAIAILCTNAVDYQERFGNFEYDSGQRFREGFEQESTGLLYPNSLTSVSNYGAQLSPNADVVSTGNRYPSVQTSVPGSGYVTTRPANNANNYGNLGYVRPSNVNAESNSYGNSGYLQPVSVNPGSSSYGNSGYRQPVSVNPGSNSYGNSGYLQPVSVNPGSNSYGNSGYLQPVRVNPGSSYYGNSRYRQPVSVNPGSNSYGSGGYRQPVSVNSGGNSYGNSGTVPVNSVAAINNGGYVQPVNVGRPPVNTGSQGNVYNRPAVVTAQVPVGQVTTVGTPQTINYGRPGINSGSYGYSDSSYDRFRRGQGYSNYQTIQADGGIGSGGGVAVDRRPVVANAYSPIRSTGTAIPATYNRQRTFSEQSGYDGQRGRFGYGQINYQ